MDVNATPVIQTPLFLTTNTTTSLIMIFITAALLVLIVGYFYSKIKLIYKLYKTLKNLKKKDITTREAAYTYTDITNTYIPGNKFSHSESDNGILYAMKYSSERSNSSSDLSRIILKTMKYVLFGNQK